MRRIILLLAVTMSAVSTWAAEKKDNSQTWKIDPNHTSVSFDIGHLGISKVRGLMNVSAGSIKANADDISKAEINVSIDVKTLNTNVAARDNHVKSDDFLSAEKFPFITFKSTAVREDKAKQKVFIDGDLTIKGVTKKITLEANPLSEEVRMPKDGKEKIIRAMIATTSINRYDFGIDYGRADKSVVGKLIDGGIGREITISISSEFSREDGATNSAKKMIPPA